MTSIVPTDNTDHLEATTTNFATREAGLTTTRMVDTTEIKTTTITTTITTVTTTATTATGAINTETTVTTTITTTLTIATVTITTTAKTATRIMPLPEIMANQMIIATQMPQLKPAKASPP